MPFAQHDEIVALGREPISADSPAGDSCRYEPEFEELQAQIDRIGSLTGEEVQWVRVVSLARTLLKDKSKDMLVMTYLTAGLLEEHGYGGLAAGLAAYKELLNTFWETCQPKLKPPQGRYNAIQYLADRLIPEIEVKGGQIRRAPKDSEKADVHRCADLIAEFDETVTKVFTGLGDTPNLLPLSRAFKALREKVGPLTAPAPAEAPAVPAAAGEGQAAQPAQPAATTAPAAAAVPDSFATATQATEAVIKIAKFLHGQDPQDPRAYLLSRAVHFGGLRQPPKDGLLPPVPPQRRQFFENLASAGNWPELLSQAETQFVVTPLWLDLQRYVATALKGQGPVFEPARHAVVSSTVALQQRLPELFDRTFKDKSPFADAPTKAWLEEEASAFGGGGGGGRAENDALSAAISEARSMLAESKHGEAVARLTLAARSCPDLRSRFRAQLALARLLLDMNRLNLARPLLETLTQQIDRYQIEEWEPELAADVFASLFECFRKSKTKPTPEEMQQSTLIFGRLCRVHPGTALKLDGDAAKT